MTDAALVITNDACALSGALNALIRPANKTPDYTPNEEEEGETTHLTEVHIHDMAQGSTKGESEQKIHMKQSHRGTPPQGRETTKGVSRHQRK